MLLTTYYKMNFSDNKIKIIIGFIVYGQHTFKYLPFFLPSLKKQTFQNFKITAFNNGQAGDENERYLRTNYPEIEIMAEGKNFGFAAAYNRMIARAKNEQADYFLMTNSDIIFEPDVLEKLTQKLEADKDLGSASPKILKWNFAENKKTDFVDSYGIALKSGLRFFDVGQGKRDSEKFRQANIIGPSGACGLFRMAALEHVKEDEKYLDERMFMYKEDCDLAYRFYLSGQKSVCVPEAVIYHDRTASAAGIGDLAAIKARQEKSLAVRRWSLLNQQLIFKKYWHLQNFWSKLNIIWFRLKIFVYISIFERDLLKALTF